MERVTENETAEMRGILKQFFDESFVKQLNITPATYAIASELLDATENCTSAISKLPMPSAYFNPTMFFSAYGRDVLIRKFKKKKGARLMNMCITTQKAKWRSSLELASYDAD